MHADAPGPANEPAPHATHAAAEVAPGVEEAVPAGHLVQLVAPSAAYSPSAQHTEAPAPLYWLKPHAEHEGAPLLE